MPLQIVFRSNGLLDLLVEQALERIAGTDATVSNRRATFRMRGLPIETASRRR